MSAAPYAFLDDDEEDEDGHGDANEIVVSASSPSFDATLASSSSSSSSASSSAAASTTSTAHLTRPDTLVRTKRARSASTGSNLASGGIGGAAATDMPVGLTRFRAVASGAARLRFANVAKQSSIRNTRPIDHSHSHLVTRFRVSLANQTKPSSCRVSGDFIFPLTILLPATKYAKRVSHPHPTPILFGRPVM